MFVKFNTQAMTNSIKFAAGDAVEITPEAEVKPVELGFLNDENVGLLGEEEEQQAMQDEDEEEPQQPEDSDKDDKENDDNNFNNNNNNNNSNNYNYKAASPDEITAFLQRYIEQHHLTKGTRLFGDKENALLNAMAENRPIILTNIVDIKKRIKTLAPVS